MKYRKCIICGKRIHTYNKAGRPRRLCSKECCNAYYKNFAFKRRLFAMEHYGGKPPKCKCCEEREYLFLTFEHPNGKDDPSHHGLALLNWIYDNDFPESIEVWCYNYNCGKYRNGGICPHKK